MCGRYTLIQTNSLGERFAINEAEWAELKGRIAPRYNIAPEQILPTITEHNRQRHLELMQWGFMPPWGKVPRDIYTYKTFNARSESVFRKPLWKLAITEHRCLVPASGFYEWQQTPLGKQPYYIHATDSELFAFAGIYRYWEVDAGIELGTFSIVTTAANHVLQDIHNRMPVILRPNDEERWLSSDTPQHKLEELMIPYPDNLIESYPVSKDVNTSHIESAALVQPMNSR